MINYSMKYGVSEAARLLKQKKETLKTWTYVFSDYLSPDANPGKGKIRRFQIDDMRVFAYVSMHWEESPDIEDIKYGLNSNSQFDYDTIDDFITGVTPLFRTMPEDINVNWGGVVFGGEFELGDIFSTANSFKIAGDRLVDIACENDEERELFQPAVYNYRHATELYIKAIIGEEISHDLKDLMKKLKVFLINEFNALPPEWFENIIEAFNDSDPKGTAFRYGLTIPKDELYADMSHIKTLMNWVSESFKKIQIERYKHANAQ
ncbi:MAG: hypothetical protein JST86_09280 [Bacteroidetes bacterium]|nr:hypothetical protein [Bacteroidota bacterium]